MSKPVLGVGCSCTYLQTKPCIQCSGDDIRQALKTPLIIVLRLKVEFLCVYVISAAVGR